MTVAAQERHLKVTSIFANPNQPRKLFDQDKLQELANSIKANGLLQAIVVTRAFKADHRVVVVGDSPELNELWEIANKKTDWLTGLPSRLTEAASQFQGKEFAGLMIVAGERRFRACQLAGLDTVLCKTVKDMTEDGVEINALIENIQRQDMTALETANALNARFNRLLAQTQGDREAAMVELERQTGWTRITINDFLRLLRCSAESVAAFEAGKIQPLAVWYLSEMSEDQQTLLLKMIEAGKCGTADKLRQAAAAIKDNAHQQAEQTSLIGDEYTLDPTAIATVKKLEVLTTKLSDLAGDDDLEATLGKMSPGQLQEMEQYLKMMQKNLKLIGKQVAYNASAKDLADIA